MIDRCHVAHVLSSLEIGGQERMALDLAAGQVRAGWRATAFSLAPPPEGRLAGEFREAGVQVEQVERRRAGFDPGLVLRLGWALRASGAALVHTHNRMALLYGAPAGRLAGLATVHTKHGRNPCSARQLLASRLAARAADAFVAVSSETAETARTGREVDPARLSVIPNGIELDRFHPDPVARARIRAELGVGASTFLLGTVGRLAPEKNQALLLRAAAPLLGDGTRLVIAGDGAEQGALEALAAALGVAGGVHFLGARRDVPAVLSALDLFALTSDTEGLPLVLPEAMATGLPVLATSVGGIPGVVEDGRTGLLAPAGDVAAVRAGLEALRADPARAAAMGQRGREAAVARFSAARMLRAYLELYRRLLDGRAGSAPVRHPRRRP